MTEPRLSEQRVNEQSMADGRSSSKCEQICQTLRRYIGSGQLGAGQQLPAERALSERFATTRITIKEALSSLEADGLIYRAERRGWFVAPPASPTIPPSTPTFTSGLASSSAPPKPGCWPTAANLPAASCAAGWGWLLLRRCMKFAASD